MKKLLFSILIIAGLVSSCNKTLTEDPNGQIIGENAITTLPALQAAVTGMYKPLQNAYTSGIASAALNAVVMGSDDITTHPVSNKAELREMDQFVPSNVNSRIKIVWLGFYQSIQNSNNVINSYKNVVADSATVAKLAGEAYFLRAFSYYWLVRLFGNIPLMTTPILTDDDADKYLTISKSTPAEVYAVIESDLKMAEVMLPNAKPAPGKPNAGTAKALLADVYLTEGGYPIKDASKYALAASKANEVITSKSTYGFDTSSLANIWSGLSSSINLPEDVFALQFNSSVAASANSVYGRSSMPSDISGWDDYLSEINFYFSFPSGKRKQYTFEDTAVSNDGKTKVFWQNNLINHPYYKKFRINTATAVNVVVSNTDQELRLIRYAHVLLTYAEASARATGSVSTDAYNALNIVRKRAGLANLVTGLSGSVFADSVVNERKWEFAGEYTRWFDLIRLEQVESANANKFNGTLPNGKTASDLAPLTTITKSQYWLPIPFGDVQLNPNLGN
ncbi:MAG: RagB/SusD family nutrient uptake outer membrane protein [Pseudopedobacter saltans]|uniref:RagB/SusD family nutrient uptake outer membrane protein n=1 Tax=Pseudopedobacter saltans TaxID=151895 RepID=A0A2W5F580_9SPHI|nr:MAG: RagB/SusD family nutrient uptake outer membrane protein [Pseudopedobacter saltans]